MGEIFHALEVLNRSMKLGLSAKDLLRAEMGFKSALAMQGNPVTAELANDPVRLAESYELKATLQRRDAKLSLPELSKLAGQAIRQPRTRVPATTFRQIDRAIAAVSLTGPLGPTKIGPTTVGPIKTGPTIIRPTTTGPKTTGLTTTGLTKLVTGGLVAKRGAKKAAAKKSGKGR